MVNDNGVTREIKIQTNAMTKHLIMGISDSNISVVFNFFLMFSRFEYSLKRAEYLKNKKKAEPSWEKFSKDEDAKKKFNSLKGKGYEELEQAIKSLYKKPPKVQIQNNFNLGWDEKSLKEGKFEGCIDAIKRVRNNLFHGGKFPSPTGSVKDPTRNPELIKYSITVLKYLLSSSPKVKRHYFEPLE